MTNPLLDFSGLPRFSDIRTEHITPAVEELLARGYSIVEKILCENAAPTWQNFVQPMTDVHERLFRAWGQVSHLNAVMNSPELRGRITRIYRKLPNITLRYHKIRHCLRNSKNLIMTAMLSA